MDAKRRKLIEKVEEAMLWEEIVCTNCVGDGVESAPRGKVITCRKCEGKGRMLRHKNPKGLGEYLPKPIRD